MNRFHATTPPRPAIFHAMLESTKHYWWMCLRWSDNGLLAQVIFPLSGWCLSKYFRSASSSPTPRKIVFPFCPLSVVLLHVEKKFPPSLLLQSSFPPSRHIPLPLLFVTYRRSFCVDSNYLYLSVHNPGEGCGCVHGRQLAVNIIEYWYWPWTMTVTMTMIAASGH